MGRVVVRARSGERRYNRWVLVSEIGEFGLIEVLARELGVEYPPLRGARQGNLLVGLGDDAVVTRRRDASIIWTTDTMVAGVHFLPAEDAWTDVGWKALAVNVSDIAAMGGSPELALVTLTLPDDCRVDDIVALYRGLREAAEAFGVTIGGGDIVRSPVFSITVALSGLATTHRLGDALVLTRDAARLRDVIAVSGTLGDAAGGVRLLLGDGGNETDAARQLLRAQQRPQPRVTLGREAVLGGLRCGIDVSDGLMQDLGHIAAASGMIIRVEAARIPTSPALRELFPSEAMGLALSGGEDYELLLVGPRPAVEALIDSSQTPLTLIGEVVSDHGPRVSVVDETGREIPLGPGGWDHFSKR
jgi:thiamine-monophosphate kinase